MADRLKPSSSCATCEAWSGGIGDVSGDCRKLAPVFMVGSDTKWPKVSSTDWCQEFSEDAQVVQAIAAARATKTVA